MSRTRNSAHLPPYERAARGRERRKALVNAERDGKSAKADRKGRRNKLREEWKGYR